MRYDTALNLVLPSWWHTVSAEDKHKACNGVGQAAKSDTGGAGGAGASAGETGKE